MDDRRTHTRTALEQVCARGDLVPARQLDAEDFIDHVNKPEFRGRRAIADSVALYRAISSDLEIRVLDHGGDGTASHRDGRSAARTSGAPLRCPASPSAASRTTRSPSTGPPRTTSPSSASAGLARAARYALGRLPGAHGAMPSRPLPSESFAAAHRARAPPQ